MAAVCASSIGGLFFSRVSFMILMILCSSCSTNVGGNDGDADAADMFAAFVQKYRRTYDTELERIRRFEIFKDTLKRIRRQNIDHESPSMPFGVTRFADQTPEEFRQMVLRRDPIMHNIIEKRFLRDRRLPTSKRDKRAAALKMKSKLPSRIDWRDSKVVNPVRNQGECGACWAFSTVETLESMYAIRTGHLPLISVQQVIDCAVDGNFGCLGGDTCMALFWMNSTKIHLVSNDEYPFVHTTGTCKFQNATKGAQLKDFTCDDYTNREELMLELLANHGPLVTAVDAVTWQDYLGGIIRFHCEASHNHAVQIVGYDTTGPVPYYIIRNSWGTDFGIDGYLHVAVGGNLCGIANEVSTLDALIN